MTPTTLFLLALLFAADLPNSRATALERSHAASLNVARHLDILSLSDWMRSRRRPHAVLPMDYGFTRFKATAGDRGVGSYNQERSQFFGVRVLEDHRSRKLICITEMQTDGSYEATYPIVVRLGADGMFHYDRLPPVGSQAAKGCHLHGITETLAFPAEKPN